MSLKIKPNLSALDSSTFFVASQVYDAQRLEQTISQGMDGVSFLDGGIIDIPLEEELKDHLKLNHNLSIGKNIIQHVQAIVWYSANHMQRARVLGYCKEDHIKQQMEEVISKTSLHQEQADNSDDISVKLAKSSHIGNCLEMALVGYRYAKDVFSDDQVDVFCIHEGDHVFLVIGRGLGEEPSDYKSWELGAVVCDPWSGSCYPAVKIDQFLMDLKKVDCSNEISIPIVAPFDPTYQSLKLFKCNFEDEHSKLVQSVDAVKTHRQAF